jgi:hypothetical protein
MLDRNNFSLSGILSRELRREIFGMEIAGDDLGLRIVKSREIGGGILERAKSLLRLEIADMLTNENVFANTERDRVLQMRTECKNPWSARALACSDRRLAGWPYCNS